MAKSERETGMRPDALFGSMGRHWAWMLALGLFYLLLGGVGLAMLFGFTVVSIQFIGALMLAGGVAQVLETVKCTGWKGMVWHLTIAVLYITGGVIVIYDPTSASKLISLALGSVLVAVGIVRIIIARQLRTRGERSLWMLLTGLAGIALGVMIMLEWPLSGLFAIALLIAVDLLLQGIGIVWLAIVAHRRTAAA